MGREGPGALEPNRRHCDMATMRLHVMAMIGWLLYRPALTLAYCIRLNHMSTSLQPTTWS